MLGHSAARRALFPVLSMAAALSMTAVLCCATVWALNPEEVERRVQEIADQLRCPTCQSVSVKDSEATFSQQIREKVTRMVEEGQSDEAIKAYFVSRYGDWILRAPPAKGVGLVLWLLPGAAILIVGAALGWRIWRAGRRGGQPMPQAAVAAQVPGAVQAQPGSASIGQATPGTAPPGLSPEQLERVQRDLRRFSEED